MILLVWTGAVYSAFYRLRLVSSPSSSSSCLALLLLLPLSSKAITLFSSRVAAALISPSLLSETHSTSEFGGTIFFFPFFFLSVCIPVAGFSRRRWALILSDSWGVNPGPRNCTIQLQASPEGEERFFSLTVEEWIRGHAIARSGKLAFEILFAFHHSQTPRRLLLLLVNILRYRIKRGCHSSINVSCSSNCCIQLD